MEKAVRNEEKDHSSRGWGPAAFTDQLGEKVWREVFGLNSFHRPALTQARGFQPPPPAKKGISNQLNHSLVVLTTVSGNMIPKQKVLLGLLTSPQVLLLGFAAHTVDPQNRLHVTLADGWGVQYGFGGPGQAHGQTCSAHQDTCHTWCVYTTHTHIDTQERKKLYQWGNGVFLSMLLKIMSSARPASAGWNGPDPVRFFTGRAGTLQQKRQKEQRTYATATQKEAFSIQGWVLHV